MSLILPKRRQLKFYNATPVLNTYAGSCIGARPVATNIFTDKLDNVLLHRRWGYLILLGVLFLLFQSVFLVGAISNGLD